MSYHLQSQTPSTLATFSKRVLGTAFVVGMLLPSVSLAQETVDPWEGWNRKVFAFNDTFDTYLGKPAAKAYQAVTPQVVDEGITNVFSNLGEVVTIVNALLQFKFEDAFQDAGRFLVNSTFGVAGIFDVAYKLGLEKKEEDFSQTFAAWGIGSGPYVVLPIFGPSTVRDAIAMVPDAYLSPASNIDHVPTRNTLKAVDMLDQRADLLDVEDLIQGDKYTFLRDAYLQNRNALVQDGEVEDDFGDEDF